MRNPFVRLKHYRRDAIHPIENHATETLAACLSLSDNIKREFVAFLFQSAPEVDFVGAESAEVTTQLDTGGSGFVDVFLEKPGEWAIVVEVKVYAPEDAAQIRKYRDWLDRTVTGKRFVFSLVRTADPSFQIEGCGGTARRIWRDLHAWFRARQNTFAEESEQKVVEFLCDYLEVESIVSTWHPKQILSYGDGVRATNALRSLFERVEERLLSLKRGFTTKVCMPEGQWPRLEVGMESWADLFGVTGYLNKVQAFYSTSAVWQGDREGFYFEIQLWNKWHRSDWSFIAARVRVWAEKLQSKGICVWATVKGNRDLDKDLAEHELTEAPLFIRAYFEETSLAGIYEAEILNMTDSDLVELVLQRVIRHCEAVLSLT